MKEAADEDADALIDSWVNALLSCVSRVLQCAHLERSSRELFAALSRRVSLLASMRHVRAFLCAIDLRPPTPTFIPLPHFPPPPRAEPVAASACASSQPAKAAAICVAPEPLLEAAELCAAELFARLASPTPTTGDLSATQLPESGSSGTALTSERRENAQ